MFTNFLHFLWLLYSFVVFPVLTYSVISIIMHLHDERVLLSSKLCFFHVLWTQVTSSVYLKHQALEVFNFCRWFFTSPIGGTQSWIVYNDLAKQNRVFILNFMIRKAMSIEWRLMISSKRCWNCTQGGDCCRLKVWWFYKVCICVSRMVLLFRDLVLYRNYIRPLNPCFCRRIV